MVAAFILTATALLAGAHAQGQRPNNNFAAVGGPVAGGDSANLVSNLNLGEIFKESRMRLRHSRLRPPKAFGQAATPVQPDEALDLRIHLKKGDRAGLERKLLEIATPGHENYGKHLSKDELDAFVRPTERTTAAVKAWLTAHGLEGKPVSPAGDILQISTKVKKADSLINANYSRFTHQKSGQTALRTLSYSLPEEIDDHVLLLEPTTDFIIKPKMWDPIRFATHSAANLTSFIGDFLGGGHLKSILGQKDKRMQDFCNQWMTPQCLQELYGFPFTKGSGTASIAVTGFINQWANEADLETFLETLRPDMANTTTFTLQELHGGENNQDPTKAGVEASLDVQFSVGVAGHTVPVTFISVGDEGDNKNGFLDLINSLLEQEELPQVLSTSYGMDEAAVGPDLANQMCDAYMQLGARGVSVLFSSGDSGVGAGECETFTPTFPSGCPYVTSIGATDGYAPEKAATFSSGGFSNIFKAPAYQREHVSGYLKQLNGTYSGLYNVTGRAFPDVSASGTNFPVVVGAAWQPVAGTSASTPVFGSMIALLNEELIGKGRKPLGFLNPWLYANTNAFTDITAGSNPGCNTDGFAALSGWDPATGLGTPLYSAMRKAAGLE
ncbi:subtilisin-like protein [Auricularia subglabra TFB-10046 SS5]|uniref:tripeptidyl-peptidase II n=1 Tax=Auricularia subglabra (strain TFB-10046 / SS5) TaxID=717982 RepID=J0WYA0_AURST|nr:subtilisin-like protein [Auricularia subglabra TFB-10046 SS5]